MESAALAEERRERPLSIVFLSHQASNLYRFRLPVMLDLDRQGHHVVALCPRDEFFERFEGHGIEAVDYTIHRRSLNPLREGRTIRAIFQRLREIRPDILHSFISKPNIYGALAGRAARVPVILLTVTGLGSYFIGNDPSTRLVRRGILLLYRLACRLADGVIFQNEDDRQYFVSRSLVPPEKTYLVRGSGVPTEEYSPGAVSESVRKQLREALELGDRPVVLMVARAIWHKGLREYAEAARRLAETHPRAVCLLAGGTDPGNPSCADETWLRSQAFRWLGERSDVRELLAISDVAALPSYREGLPRTLLEAGAMGKPLVASDAVGCRDVVAEGENGFLVPLHDGSALAERIGRLLNDPELRARLGANARERTVAQFSTEAVCRQYQEIYRLLWARHLDSRR